MDNFTHSLAGILVAEALLSLGARGRAEASPARGALLFASALSNNVPDLDFIYSGITPGKLGYLLHHRGHTHTLVAGVLMSVLVYFPFQRWLRHLERKGASISTFDRRALLALCLFGPVLHLSLDATNNYGVHPFWPLSSRWFYGDAVFIVEPWLWVAALPALFVSARTRLGRWLFAGLGLLGVLAADRFSALPWPLLGSLFACAGALYWFSRRLRATPRLVAAMAAWSFVTAVFAAGSARAEATLRAALASDAVVDVVTTPRAANPICYSVLGVEVTDERYRVTLATLSLLPSLLPAEDCPNDREGTTAPLERVSIPSGPGLSWYGAFEGSRAELRPLLERCDVSALLRFVRVPFWKPAEGGGVIVGDLRYDRAEALDFAEVEFPALPVCPPHVPPWVPPRVELFSGSGQGLAH